MNNPQNGELLRKAAEKAAQLPFFLAHALRAYQSLNHLDDQQLADYLDCPLEALWKLALCRRPNPSPGIFLSEVRQIAAYGGANALQLARLLRDVSGREALRQSSADAARGASDGMLLAARDRERPGEETEGEPEKR